VNIEKAVLNQESSINWKQLTLLCRRTQVRLPWSSPNIRSILSSICQKEAM